MQRHRRGLRLLLAAITISLAATSAASAEPNGARPVSLIITYRAAPQTRASFRAYLAGPGATRLSKLKVSAGVEHARILYSCLAASPVDAVIVLDFAHYSDLSRWVALERGAPGGLDKTGLALAQVTSSNITSVVAHGDKATDIIPVYLMATYELLTRAFPCHHFDITAEIL